MNENIAHERVQMRESTSVYNPHYLIEVNGDAAVHVYIDAFNSKAQAHNVATSFYLSLVNTFTKKTKLKQ